MRSILNHIFNVLRICFYCIIGLLITYAVLFSLVGTIVLYNAYIFAVTPIREVQLLNTTNPHYTAYMRRYLEEARHDSTGSDSLYQIFIPLDSIAENLKSAVLAVEDDGFYTHPGVAIESILAAAAYNRSHGKLKRGASTITQQLAKNLFLNSERSFERKIKEAVYTLLMEHYLGKDRIFELYLNYAEWGKNIFGCEAASQFYFKKSAHQLSRNEAARLAAVLAMPSRITPHHIKSTFLAKRLAVIAQNLLSHGTINDSDYFAITGTLPPRTKFESDTARNDLGQSDENSANQFAPRAPSW